MDLSTEENRSTPRESLRESLGSMLLDIWGDPCSDRAPPQNRLLAVSHHQYLLQTR